MTLPVSESRTGFEGAKEKLLREFELARDEGLGIRLGKRTSNLFRTRHAGSGARLDVRDFTSVISVDRERMEADVGGMTTYETLVGSTLRHGMMPAVVPQLKTITLGGAVTGGGIESSSFRYGFVHETVRELEVLTGDGRTVVCRPDNEHRDLFYGFPNSYGALGYALRLRIRLMPVKRFVRLHHRRETDVERFYSRMEALCLREREAEGGIAFVDGSVFSGGDMYRTTGVFSDTAPVDPSDYTFMNIYHRSIRERESDILSTRNYLWRWDTDWFWCSKAFGMENRVLRFLAGSLGLLRSSTYWKIRNWNERTGFLRRLGFMRSVEWVIQDVEIPVDRAPEFHRFLREKVGIHPFWICPVMAVDPHVEFPLYRTDPTQLYINFGFWGGVESRREPGYHNRLVEEKVAELGGMKSLYSSSFYTQEEFWEHYNRPAYDVLKRRYDPEGVFPGLYEKCVKGR